MGCKVARIDKEPRERLLFTLEAGSGNQKTNLFDPNAQIDVKWVKKQL